MKKSRIIRIGLTILSIPIGLYSIIFPFNKFISAKFPSFGSDTTDGPLFNTHVFLAGIQILLSLTQFNIKFSHHDLDKMKHKIFIIVHVIYSISCIVTSVLGMIISFALQKEANLFRFSFFFYGFAISFNSFYQLTHIFEHRSKYARNRGVVLIWSIVGYYIIIFPLFFLNLSLSNSHLYKGVSSFFIYIPAITYEIHVQKKMITHKEMGRTSYNYRKVPTNNSAIFTTSSLALDNTRRETV